MQFRRRRVHGKTQTTYKEWRSDCGHYRLCWRNETPGLGSARYYATVRCCRGDSREFWDFAADRRPYRTLKAAQEACQNNQRVWHQFIDLADAPRKGHLDRARQQIIGSVVGTKPTTGRILNSCPPIWALPKLAPWLLQIVSSDYKESHA
jgi:hypothetical protein